jgi:hypothetical protein
MITSHKHNVFVARVLERDNFECQHCYTKEKLHIHHIKKVKTNPELQYEVNNGITLCHKCHKIFENWVDAPWNKRICWTCEDSMAIYETHDTVPFMKLWDGKKWLIKEVAKKVCHK